MSDWPREFQRSGLLSCLLSWAVPLCWSIGVFHLIYFVYSVLRTEYTNANQERGKTGPQYAITSHSTQTLSNNQLIRGVIIDFQQTRLVSVKQLVQNGHDEFQKLDASFGSPIKEYIAVISARDTHAQPSDIPQFPP